MCVCVCVCAQLCLTLCDPMDCSLLGTSIHGIFQERKLEWVAISHSRGSPALAQDREVGVGEIYSVFHMQKILQIGQLMEGKIIWVIK